MAEFSEKPDTQFFQDAEEHLRGKWDGAHEIWKKVDSYYRGDYEVWDRSTNTTNRSSYRSSVPTSIIDHAVDTQMSFNPKAHRPPPHPKNQGKSVAWSDEIEVAMKMIFDDSSDMQTSAPLKTAGKHILHLGYTILDLGWDATDRQGPEGSSYNPARLTAPHPSTVLLDPNEKTPTLGIKYFDMRASKLEAWTKSLHSGEDFERPEVTVFSPGKNKFDMVDLKQLWTPFHTMLMTIEGKELFIMDNTWERTPWSHGFSGFGMEMTDHDKRGPENYAVGLLNAILDTIKAKAQADSAKHQNLMDRSYPKPGVSPQIGSEDAAQMLERGLLEGEKTDFWFMDQVQLDRSVFEVGREDDQEMVNATYSRSLTGERQEGVDTVGQQAILTTASQKKFDGSANTLASMLGQQFSNILRLIDLNGDPVGVNNKKITKNMIEGDYTISANFKATDPVLGIQKREIAMREVAAGLKSWERYQTEDAELENLTAERAAMDRDLVDNHPAIINQRARRAALEMGEDLDQAIAEQQQQEAEEAAATQEARATAGVGSEGIRGPQRDIPTQNTLIREGLTGDTQNPARGGQGVVNAP